MNDFWLEIILWAGVSIAIIAVVAKIPGFSQILKSVSEGLVRILLALIVSSGAYVVWLLKGIVNVHVEILKHLRYGEEHFDPEKAVRDSERR